MNYVFRVPSYTTSAERKIISDSRERDTIRAVVNQILFENTAHVVSFFASRRTKTFNFPRSKMTYCPLWCTRHRWNGCIFINFFRANVNCRTVCDLKLFLRPKYVRNDGRRDDSKSSVKSVSVKSNYSTRIRFNVGKLNLFE